MTWLPNNISFPQWIDHVFDHSVKKNAWHMRKSAAHWQVERHAIQAVEYLTRLFENPVTTLARFSDDQIGQGFWYLVGSFSYANTLKVREVSLPDRLRCIQAMFTTFEQLFGQRCLPTWDVEQESKKRASTQLDIICYMWWDIFPLIGSDKVDDHIAVSAEILSVLTKELALKSEACQQSALHGLGHWHLYHPNQVEAIVDRYTSRSPKLRPELLDYAQHAHSGNVL